MIEFPKTYSVLLIGLPGVGKSEYCMHLAKGHLKNGEKVVYVTTEKSPSDIRERMKEIGMDLDAHEGESFLFIDVFTRSAGTKEEKVLYVDNPSNLNLVSVKLSEATDALGKPVRIIFDSLSTFFLHAPEGEIRSFFESINTKIKMDHSFALFTLHEEMHDDKIVIALKAMVLSVLEMEIEDAPSRKRKFRVAFAKKGVSYSSNWFEFRITKEGLEFSPMEEARAPEEELKVEEKEVKPEREPKRKRSIFKIARTVLFLIVAIIVLGAIFGGDGNKDETKFKKTELPPNVIFFENFDSGKAGWELDSKWFIEFPEDETNGMLASSDRGTAYTSFGDWRDFDISFKLAFHQSKERIGNIRISVRQSREGQYNINIGEGIRLSKTIVEDFEKDRHRTIDFDSKDHFFSRNQFYDIKIEVQGDVINVYVAGKQIFGFTDVDSPLEGGEVSFETYDTKVYIDDIVVKGPQNGPSSETSSEATPSCQDCPDPGAWSECTEEAVITRTNYRCGAKTDYTCESYTEEKACQIKMVGLGGLRATVTPTIGGTVAGVIEVEVTAVPEGTQIVQFIFYPQGVRLGDDMSLEDLARTMQYHDSSGEDGWSALFDTAEVEDGIYNIFVGATYEGAPSENPWISIAGKQVVVEN